MEEERSVAGGGGAAASRASTSASVAVVGLVAAVPPMPPAPAMAPAGVPAQEGGAGRRQRFAVELRPGETTIVSWKKLLRENGVEEGFPSSLPRADPAAGVNAGPGNPVQSGDIDLNDALPQRFSAVIEKIERLYMGNQSSDEEELDNIPDDDQYDTEDSFIDDAELDEYFQVDKSATKHNGYFVNRGKLERIESSSSPTLEPKKRRRRVHSEKDGRQILDDPANMTNVRIKAAARSMPLLGKKSSSSSRLLTSSGENNHEGKHTKRKLNASTVTYRKRSADFNMDTENPRVKVPNKDASLLPLEMKGFDKQKSGISSSRDLAYKSRGTSETFNAMYQVSRETAMSSQVESRPKKFSDAESELEESAVIRRKENNGYSGFPEMNSAGITSSTQAVQSSSIHMKEGAAVRPKGTTLERAIRDLEKIVAECRPPDLVVPEVDSSGQGVKRRLPQEVKQKLAKVARLSANQSKISEDDLIDRLMGIIGHLVQRKTLKRNMKEMVELGLSAKQQKADRFQQIKREVNDMIRTRVAVMRTKVSEQHDGSTGDFQEIPSNDETRLRGRSSMDRALEDKMCDLYDLYVEGMDEDKGPQSRKFYVQLAELWPSGFMDNVGIKEAIFRSKERKRAMYNRHKVRDEERIKRRRLASAMRVEETNLSTQARVGHERPAAESTSHVFNPPDKILSSQSVASTDRISDPTPLVADSGQYPRVKHHEKVKGGSNLSITQDDESKAVRKKLKRPESDAVELHSYPLKLPTQDGKEKHKPHKYSEDTNMSHQQKPCLPLPGPPPPDQPS